MQEDDFLLDQLKVAGVIPKGDAPYTEGSLNAPICLVGEAPGEEEENEGRPFVGKAGNLLDNILYSSLLKRSTIRLENVFQFRPYKNNITPYISFPTNRKGKIKTGTVFTEAKTKLLERLNQTTAKVIVPLGRVALYALTGHYQIQNWRGSVLTDPALPNKLIIPAIHPAAALRVWEYKHLIINDLQRAKLWADGDAQFLQRNFCLDPSMEEIYTYISKCHAAPIIGFDIEVTRNHLSHISLALSPTDCMCIPFYDKGHEYFTLEQEGEVLQLLSHLLSDNNVIKLGHNAVFDAGFLYYRYGIPVRPIDDTMIAARIVQPDRPATLAFITSIYCNGEPYYKDDGKMWIKDPAQMLAVDPMQFRRYNAMDSAVLMEIFPQLIADLKHQGNYETYRYQVALVEPLVYMQSKGIRMNVTAMKQESEKALRRINELEAELTNIIGYQINPNSPPQVMEYFYGKMEQKPYYKTKKTKTGERERTVTADVKALRRLSAKGFRAAAVILEIRKLAKLRGTYYNMKLDADGYMRCSFKPVGTRYGRIASSKTIFKTGANLLNQPKAMKKLMLPEDGNIFVNIDLAQAELVAVANMWHVSRMLEAIDKGLDLHKNTASFIFNKPLEQISDEEGSAELGNGILSERGVGKQSNHAFNYGLGPDKFSMNNEIDLAAAKFIHAKYHAMYPEINRAHAAIVEQLKQHKIMTNVYGRKYYIMRRWGPDLFEAAYNFGPQSTVADKLNRDGFLPTYYNQELFSHVSLVNQIYDSIVFEYPIKYKHEIQGVCETICKNLEKPIPNGTRSFVIHPDVSIGFNLGDMKELKLSQVYDKNSFDTILEEFIGASIS